MEKNYSISLLRGVSTLCIIITHMLGYYNNYMTYWFNIAMLVFLFISGFLYGKKDIKSPWKWIKKQFIKIAKVYYPYLIIVIIITYVLKPEILSLKQIFTSVFMIQAFTNGVPNIEHLWFLTYIIMCYIITPLLLQPICCKFKKTSISKYISLFIIYIITMQIITIPLIFVLKFKTAWIVCYSAGYFISYRYRNEDTNLLVEKNILENIIFIFSIIAILAKLYIEIVLYKKVNGIKYEMLTIIVQYLKVVISTGICLFVIDKIGTVNLKRYKNIFEFSDKYSFEIYVVHQIFILGTFTLMNLTSYKFLNITIVFIAIFISAFLLKEIERLLSKIYIINSH